VPDTAALFVREEAAMLMTAAAAARPGSEGGGKLLTLFSCPVRCGLDKNGLGNECFNWMQKFKKSYQSTTQRFQFFTFRGRPWCKNVKT
jgi:hypothetical protein